mmetsp:Transcript_14158/g.46086  ORF Transcript_14158/g.46086 Transcript_14158/m.46086 type:complete len:388 (-) Transcript_14158:224-1387(-)
MPYVVPFGTRLQLLRRWLVTQREGVWLRGSSRRGGVFPFHPARVLCLGVAEPRLRSVFLFYAASLLCQVWRRSSSPRRRSPAGTTRSRCGGARCSLTRTRSCAGWGAGGGCPCGCASSRRRGARRRASARASQRSSSSTFSARASTRPLACSPPAPRAASTPTPPPACRTQRLAPRHARGTSFWARCSQRRCGRASSSSCRWRPSSSPSSSAARTRSTTCPPSTRSSRARCGCSATTTATSRTCASLSPSTSTPPRCRPSCGGRTLSCPEEPRCGSARPTGASTSSTSRTTGSTRSFARPPTPSCAASPRWCRASGSACSRSPSCSLFWAAPTRRSTSPTGGSTPPTRAATTPTRRPCAGSGRCWPSTRRPAAPLRSSSRRRARGRR